MKLSVSTAVLVTNSTKQKARLQVAIMIQEVENMQILVETKMSERKWRSKHSSEVAM